MSFSFGIGISMNRNQSRRFLLPIITAIGSTAGSGFKIGTIRTIIPGTATPRYGGTISYDTRWLIGSNVVSTNAIYTISENANNQTVSGQWRAVETGGSRNTQTPWQVVASGLSTYNAPVSNDSLGNVSYIQGSGVQTVNAATSFTVAGDADRSGITWSVSGPAGVVINASGVVSIPTTALLSNQTIIVTATNSGGSDTSSFAVNVSVSQGLVISAGTSGIRFSSPNTIIVSSGTSGIRFLEV